MINQAIGIDSDAIHSRGTDLESIPSQQILKRRGRDLDANLSRLGQVSSFTRCHRGISTGPHLARARPDLYFFNAVCSVCCIVVCLHIAQEADEASNFF